MKLHAALKKEISEVHAEFPWFEAPCVGSYIYAKKYHINPRSSQTKLDLDKEKGER